MIKLLKEENQNENTTTKQQVKKKDIEQNYLGILKNIKNEINLLISFFDR